MTTFSQLNRKMLSLRCGIIYVPQEGKSKGYTPKADRGPVEYWNKHVIERAFEMLQKRGKIK